MINNEKTQGMQIRARANHIENNEQNSRYFFAKEKSYATTKNLTNLHMEDGTNITDPEKILECQKKYCKTH